MCDLLELSGVVVCMVDKTRRDRGGILWWSSLLSLSFLLNGEGEASSKLSLARSCHGFFSREAVFGNGESSR